MNSAGTGKIDYGTTNAWGTFVVMNITQASVTSSSSVTN